MNENIDLTKILKDCPKDTKLYTTIWGEVTFRYISEGAHFHICVKSRGEVHYLTKNGKWYDLADADCILFPSKDQRDWSKFTAPWLEKQCEILRTNECTWLYLVSDVLTWKDGIGQYLDNPEVQEFAKRLCDKYAQKLYNPSVLSDSSNTGKDKQKSADKFDPKTLNPFDKVLGRNCIDIWRCDFFSFYNGNSVCPNVCIGDSYLCCIPYNDETKHLVGTTERAPEYYRYWEE